MKRLLLSAAAAALTAFTFSAAQAEVVLKAVAGLPETTAISQVFMKFVEKVNEDGKGIVKIDFIGGPEAMPGLRQAQSVQRGLADIAYLPGSYTLSVFKEVDALLASDKTIEEMRSTGVIDELNAILEPQSGLNILGWFDTSARFYLFSNKEPEVGEKLDFKGARLYSTPTYRGLQEAHNAQPVMMEAGEILTALQSGVIDGYGWQEYGVAALGLSRVTKHRIDVPFYRGNVLALINAEKYKALPADAKAVLDKAAQEWEVEAEAFIDAKAAAEETEMLAAGMTKFAVSEPAAGAYIKAANDVVWERVKTNSPDQVAKLKSILTRAGQ